MQTQKITVEFPTALLERLVKVAEHSGETLSECMSRVLAEYVLNWNEQ